MNSSISQHIPAFEQNIVDLLSVDQHHIFVDGTCGEGEHAKIIAPILSCPGLYLALDRDSEILRRAKENLSEIESRILFFQASYADLGNILQELHIDQVDRILLDLGLSMYHLRTPTRGFSFTSTDLLDMRFDPASSPVSALDVVNHFQEEEISDILYLFGEEQLSRKIARRIVEGRKVQPIMTCCDLAKLIAGAVGAQNKRHPATKSFQALRIYVNAEFSHLEKFLAQAHQWLNPQGLAALITYHSLEDRIVKQFAKDSPYFHLRDKKPQLPSRDEILHNPAVRTAKLRVLLRC